MSTKYTRVSFITEVLAEIEMIKKFATSEEIARLDFKNFNHRHSDNCIYGQMTGHCTSPRAKELFTKKYANVGKSTDFSYVYSNNTFNDQDFTLGVQYTALEKYLYIVKSGTHKKIIKYLKGEINELKLR